MNPLPPESPSDTLPLTSQRLKSILKAFFGVSIHNIHSLFPLRSVRGRRQIFQKALRGLCPYSLPFFSPSLPSDDQKKKRKKTLETFPLLFPGAEDTQQTTVVVRPKCTKLLTAEAAVHFLAQVGVLIVVVLVAGACVRCQGRTDATLL